MHAKKHQIPGLGKINTKSVGSVSLVPPNHFLFGFHFLKDNLRFTCDPLLRMDLILDIRDHYLIYLKKNLNSLLGVIFSQNLTAFLDSTPSIYSSTPDWQLITFQFTRRFFFLKVCYLVSAPSYLTIFLWKSYQIYWLLSFCSQFLILLLSFRCWIVYQTSCMTSKAEILWANE